MTTPDSLDIPRAKYGLWMALATAVALVSAYGVALGLGGAGMAAGLATGAVGIGSILTFGPAVMRVDHEHWGVVVMGFGAARALLVLGAAYAMGEQHPEMPGRPMYMGAAAGAILLLVVESVVAVNILSRLERRKADLRAAEQA